MESDFLYPQIADRRTPEEWEAAGAPDIRAQARKCAREILASHFPGHLTEETDRRLRAMLDIRLPRNDMMKG